MKVSKSYSQDCGFGSSLNIGIFSVKINDKGGFTVMAEITRILAANTRRQFFFVITTTASTPCLDCQIIAICSD